MSTTKQLPPVEFLRECLEYDYTTGALYWKNRPASHFSDKYRSAEGCANNWNSKNAGKPALSNVSKYGYLVGTLNKQVVKSHRVIWKLVTGDDPVGMEIDHIDGDRANNKFENLRLATSSENSRNTATQKRSKSGRQGVTWKADRQRWLATITVDGKQHYIGMFKDVNDAITAREKAEAKFGFHLNHGRSSKGYKAQ